MGVASVAEAYVLSLPPSPSSFSISFFSSLSLSLSPLFFLFIRTIYFFIFRLAIYLGRLESRFRMGSGSTQVVWLVLRWASRDKEFTAVSLYDLNSSWEAYLQGGFKAQLVKSSSWTPPSCWCS